MSYMVKLDNNTILDYSLDDKTVILLEPKLEAELNKTDSFEFKMPPIHKYYTSPLPLVSIVEIFEDDDLIWFGRVLSVQTDYYREKTVTCEGPFGFFNDTVQRYCEYDEIDILDFFEILIENHNEQAPESRQFTVGTVDIDSKTVYRKLDYESTKECLETMCLDAEGGYLIFRREEGVNYIDWLKDMPYECNQPVEYGLNLTNISSSFDASELITCILPLGDTVKENKDSSKGEIISKDDPRVGKPLTLEHEYGTDLIAATEAVDIYGRIISVVTFSDINDAETLKAEAESYLKEEMYNRMTFECTAVELKSYGPGANDNYDHFKLGQKIHCRSKPHALDAEFPLLKMSISLDTAVKTISLGTAPRRELTEIMKNE